MHLLNIQLLHRPPSGYLIGFCTFLFSTHSLTVAIVSHIYTRLKQLGHCSSRSFNRYHDKQPLYFDFGGAKTNILKSVRSGHALNILFADTLLIIYWVGR